MTKHNTIYLKGTYISYVGALKQYLRELPEPLLSHELHSEWISAAGYVLIKITLVSKHVHVHVYVFFHRVGDEGERMQHIWTVTQKLPNENRENLK